MPAKAARLPAFSCEIHAPTGLAEDLERTVAYCATQADLRAEIVTRHLAGSAATVTLQLAPQQAAADHPVWCIVCRLACLCPQARVGVLVQAADAFARPASARLAG